MGSLRNPIGPLPSTIYWRRRAVLLTVVGLLAILVVWVVTGGGGGGDNDAGGPDGKNPATSITPGPSGSGPAISQAPGGRDESGDESGSGGDSSGSGAGGGSGSGSGSGAGGGDTTGGAGATGGGTSDGGGKNGSSSGEQVPAGSSLPNCTAGAVKLTVRSVRNAYEPGANPTFELIARNSSGGDCKLDLGPDNTVVTITPADADDTFWASDDCHETAGSLMFKVPAGDRVTYTVEWNRDPSAPNCATPAAGSATAGTYLVEAKAPGLATARTSFVLEKD
ncbi:MULTISPECIES: hypothetical protein [Streptomyces]|uniref:Uncharacterized protein n=1 Tax=Streptomyces caniscabiei TaxID=2746961 RepID=A0ABU4MY76_9ACTN|nr:MULTISPECIES: hypothetical protein [Streptomyces]MBE4741522.1 hypothetical protein [Streptomyces caniscabiei]MBE4761679.1 hypothetical protein [Streptomyces caniscabiei]MBE4775856.1 hypothetical protein [Streptomyces caniscabiei]MBE4790171.1 hypothetical protein [Streptomyces caniscabiei]MBE4799415.1 hypothetical protein [Streptomyces caniscabiei]